MTPQEAVAELETGKVVNLQPWLLTFAHAVIGQINALAQDQCQMSRDLYRENAAAEARNLKTIAASYDRLADKLTALELTVDATSKSRTTAPQSRSPL